MSAPTTAVEALDDLESSLAEPAPDDWDDLRAHGVERDDYILAWRTAKQILRLHTQDVMDRLGDDRSPSECERLAALGVIARLHALTVALRWDVRFARAERDRLEEVLGIVGAS